VGFDLEATAGKVNPRRRLDIGSDDAKDGGSEARSAISPDEWGLVEEAEHNGRRSSSPPAAFLHTRTGGE
jgi:hypothetical protein